MSLSEAAVAPAAGRADRGLNKPVMKDLQRLKQRDNHTNFRFVAANYAIFAATVAAALWLYAVADTTGWGLWLTVPVTIVAVIIIGGFQHQLGGIVHEGTHYILFADRTRNERVADWLGAFPLYTSTYAFRLHHLAHHQFVNDPERDPNFAQAHDSGHWLDFPLSQFQLLKALIRQLNPVLLVRYILARAKYSAIGTDANPYADASRMGSPWAIRIGALFTVVQPAIAIYFIVAEQWGLLLVSQLALSGFVLAYYALLPASAYAQSRIDPIISHRVTTVSRMGYLVIVYGALSLTCYLTGKWAWAYFGLFWILPLFTTFPLFMIAREWAQHGNADRGRLTNSRIFHVNPVIRWLVLPWGMEYHLPHHIYCSVPHYRLKDLHAVLSADPEYREKAMVVHGVLGTGKEGRPSIVQVLGPQHSGLSTEISVQDDTLELADVNDAAAIARHSDASRTPSTLH